MGGSGGVGGWGEACGRRPLVGLFLRGAETLIALQASSKETAVKNHLFFLRTQIGLSEALCVS